MFKAGRRKNDGWFNTRLYLSAVVLGLIGAMVLVTLSRNNLNSRADGFSTLELIGSTSGRIYGRWLIEDNKEFAIEYVHSVNNSTVREFFRIEGKEIHPVSVYFYSFGAGMQTELEEGQTVSRDGDAMIITGFNRTYTELNYIVGTVTDHLLLINEERISLRNLCGRNAHVTLRVRQEN